MLLFFANDRYEGPVNTMIKIFISYSRKDIAFARVLHDSLTKNELDVWIDWNDIIPSSDWKEEIFRAIESVDVFVYIVSKNSVKSQVCNLEIAHAQKNNKRIIPIILPGISDEKIPKEIDKIHWIQISESEIEDFHESFKRFYEAINTDLEWLKYHTILQNRALEWEKNKHNSNLVLRGNVLQNAEKQISQKRLCSPAPTILQMQYIFASKMQESRKKLGLIFGLLACVIVLAAATITALVQRNKAIVLKNDLIDQKSITELHLHEYQANALWDEDNQGPFYSTSIALNTIQSHPSYSSMEVLNRWIDLSPVLISRLDVDKGYYDGDFHSLGFYTDISINNAMTLLAVAFQTNLLEVYNTETWEKTYTLQLPRDGEDHEIIDIEFSSNNRDLIIAQGSIIIIWDPTTDQIISQISAQDKITSFDVSPDGNLIITNDKTLYDLQGGKKICRIGFAGEISNPLFNPQGTEIITYSVSSNKLMVWSATDCVKILEISQNSNFQTAQYSIDGKTIFSFGDDDVVRMWDAESGNEIGTYVSEKLSILATSPGGKYLAYGGDSITIVDLESGNKVLEIPQQDQITVLAFSSDERYIASGNSKNFTNVWEVSSGCEVARILLNSQTAMINFLENDNVIVTTGDIFDGYIRVADITQSKILTCAESTTTRPEQNFAEILNEGTLYLYDLISDEYSILDEDAEINYITSSPDNQYVIAKYQNQYYVMWNTQTRKRLSLPILNESEFNFFRFSNDSIIMATVTSNNQVQLYNLEDQQEMINLLPPKKVENVYFSPDNRLLVTIYEDNAFDIWEINSAKKLMEYSIDSHFWGFSDDGKYYLISIDDTDGTKILLLDSQQMELFKSIDIREPLTVVDFSPDNQYFITGSENGESEVLEIATGNKIASRMLGDDIDIVKFSPDSEIAITTDIFGQVKLFSPITDTSLWEFTIPSLEYFRTAHDIKFSHDSQLIAVISDDNKIHVYDIQSGAEIDRIEIDENVYIHDVYFSADDQTLISWTSQKIQKWPLDTEKMTSAVCSRLPYQLTHEEFIEYYSEEEWNFYTENETCPLLIHKE